MSKWYSAEIVDRVQGQVKIRIVRVEWDMQDVEVVEGVA
jgi:hypothetical protein